MGLELAKAFVRIRGDASKLEGDLNQVREEVTTTFDEIAKTAAGFLGTFSAATTGLLRQGLQLAGQFEQTNIAFETMLGSAEETRETLAGLTEFAAKTPFTMPGILQAARGLIQFGERGDEMMETLEILGNAAAGTSVPFGFLALIFNQIRGVGKLLTQDFRQLSTRGVLSLQDIADHFDVTTAAAQKMVSTGKVGFEDVRDILKGLSEEGGRFFNLMERQSESLLGLQSTLSDAWNIMTRVLATALVPAAKRVVAEFIRLVERIDAFIGRAPAMTSGAFAGAAAFATLGTTISGAAVALRFFGITLKRFVLGAALSAGIVGLGAAVGLLAIELASVESIQDALRKSSEELKEAWESLRKAAVTAINSVRQMVAGAGEEIPSLTEMIGNKLVAAINKTTEGIKMLSSFIEQAFGRVKVVITPALNVIDLLRDKFTSFGNTVKGMIGGVAGTIASFIDRNETKFKEIGFLFVEFYRNLFETVSSIFSKVRDLVSNVATTIAEKFQSSTGISLVSFKKLFDGIITLFRDILDALSLVTTDWNLTWEFLKTNTAIALTKIAQKAIVVFNTIKATAIAFVKANIQMWKDWAKTVFTLLSRFGEFFQSVVDGIRRAAMEGLTGGDFFGRMTDEFNRSMERLLEGVPDIGANAGKVFNEEFQKNIGADDPLQGAIDELERQQKDIFDRMVKAREELRKERERAAQPPPVRAPQPELEPVRAPQPFEFNQATLDAIAQFEESLKPKQRAPIPKAPQEPLLGPGRFGFEAFGQRIQDALLQREKEQMDKRRNALLEKIAEMQRQQVEATKESSGKSATLT